MWTGDLALLVLGDCQDFRELFLAGSTQKTVLGHDHLPVESVVDGNPSRPSCWRQLPPSPKTSPEAKQRELRLIGVEYEPAMRGRTTALVLSVTLLGFAGAIAIRARGTGQAPSADQPLSEQARARLLATGKELFMTRCARCHDERGDKPLNTGPPLHSR